MFDAHAHIGELTDKAIINTSSPDEAHEACLFPYKSVGLLPESGSADLALFENYIRQGYYAGEIGLDRRFDNKEMQQNLFREAMRIAISYNRLITIHCVGYTDLLIKELIAAKPYKFIVHGFTGSYETAKSITVLGGIISLGPRSLKSRDISRIISLPFIAETDMKTGPVQTATLKKTIRELSLISGRNIEEETDKHIKELLDV